MAYLLTVFAIVGTLLWVSPTRTFIRDRLGEAGVNVQGLMSTSSAPLIEKVRHIMSSLHEKGVDILRQQLHHAIDAMLKSD